MSRLLAIGDIHGCSQTLETLLESVALRDDDHLVFLGDYVDRGPDSRGVIERLIELSKRPHFVALRGNHDDWMLKARQDKSWFQTWVGVGGVNTIQSYGAKSLKAVPETHWQFLESTQLFHQTEHFIFAHAAIEGDLELADMSEEALMWRRVTESTPHFSGKTLICGHSSQKNGVPLDLGHAICIDTCVYGKQGWLSCLDTNSFTLWQANQKGETRQSWLDHFPIRH